MKRMSKCKRMMAGIVFAAMLALSVVPAPAKAASKEDSKGAAKGVTIESKDNKVPVYQAGQSQKWTLTVTNHTGADLGEVTVRPKLGNNNDVWPFRTDAQNYQETVNGLKEGESKDVTFDFTQREDVPTSRYTIRFEVAYADQVTTVKQYVNTTAKPEENQGSGEGASQPGTSGSDYTGDGSDGTAMAGGFSNGDAAYSGGGSSSGNGSVPRVIVTGFSTDPAEVRAGSNFTLTIHLKNTSKSTRVSNMLFDLNTPTEGNDAQTTAPAFLPASGSSSIYLDGIAANGTADISIQLNAKADLVQKPYSIDMSMKYEDANAAQIEASSSISIPVKQDARFEFSDFELSPETIAVGEESNAMCSLYNMGRIKLYNVKAVFEGKGIKKEELFIGNVEPGATASIDAMLEGAKAVEDSKVTMTLSYEDEAGSISTTTKELSLQVTETSEEDGMIASDMMPEEQGGSPLTGILIAAAVVIVIVVVVLVLRRKKKKQIMNEEEELLYELDGPSEDEQ